MTRQYDLRHEGWIPVLHADNTLQNLGLIDVFRQAPEIRALAVESPLQRFALTRLLLAILHRSIEGPRNTDHWVQVRDSWPDVVVAVEDYLNEFAEHFDLLHPATPYMQVPDLHTTKGEFNGLERLVLDVPSGEQYFTVRSGTGLDSISFADAALWLTALQAFDVSGIKSGAVGDPRQKGGKGYPIGPGWSGQLGGIQAHGDTLKTTLLYNLVIPDNIGPHFAGVDFEADVDVPYWERRQREPGTYSASPRFPDPVDYRSNFATGPLDLYTWQTRRVRLIADDHGITQVLVSNGDKILPQNMHSMEPHSQWRYSDPQSKKFKTQVFMPAEYDPDKSAWRGLSALLAQAPQARKDSQRAVRPGVLEHLGALTYDGHIGASALAFSTVGVIFGAQQSSISTVVDDHLELATALLPADNKELRQLVVEELDRIESIAFRVGIFARDLVHVVGDNSAETAQARAKGDYYSRCDTIFRTWLSSLSDPTALNHNATELEEQILKVVYSLADDSLAQMPPWVAVGREDPSDSSQWLSGAIAQRRLIAGVRKILTHVTPPAHSGGQ